MIKVEQQDDQAYYCLNPYCFKPFERQFSKNHCHFQVQQCSKWILPLKDIISMQPLPFNNKQIQDLEIDFEKQPLQACRKLDRLKISDWQKWLKTQENRLKKDLINALEIQFEAISTKIAQITQLPSFLNDLANLVSTQSSASEAINDYYNKSRQSLIELGGITFFQKHKLKERVQIIKSEITNIFPLMMETKKLRFEVLSHQEERSYHQFMFEKGDNAYNRLQVIASAFNRKAGSYSIEKEEISLECILCERKVRHMIRPSEKQNMKKFVAEQILSHLYCSHYQEVGFAFSRKISKSYRQAQTFLDCLDKSKDYGKIRLIDRQSGIIFEQTYDDYKLNKNCYNVQVVSIQNEHMARGKHILVNVCQSIDFLIAIISYICSQRDQEIEIISKKQSLKLGILQLLDLKVSHKKEGSMEYIVKKEEK